MLAVARGALGGSKPAMQSAATHAYSILPCGDRGDRGRADGESGDWRGRRHLHVRATLPAAASMQAAASLSLGVGGG